MDTQHFSKQNDGSKNIFTVIHILHKHIWVVCLIGRMSSAILVAIRSSLAGSIDHRNYRQTGDKRFSEITFTQAVKAG